MMAGTTNCSPIGICHPAFDFIVFVPKVTRLDTTCPKTIMNWMVQPYMPRSSAGAVSAW
jgi:hypothetical protein